MQLKGAIFDMDGTLLDSMPAWCGLIPKLLEDAGIPQTPALWAQLSPLSVQEMIPFLQTAYGLPWTEEEIFAGFQTSMARFYREQVQTKPGLPEFLTQLKAKGVHMYVATATDRPLAELALDSTGLLPYFQGVLTSSEVGVSKRQSPAIYEQALVRLELNKQDVVVFEDALHAVRTAKQAGFRVCAVYDPMEERHQADIRDLADDYILSYEALL